MHLIFSSIPLGFPKASLGWFLCFNEASEELWAVKHPKNDGEVWCSSIFSVILSHVEVILCNFGVSSMFSPKSRSSVHGSPWFPMVPRPMQQARHSFHRSRLHEALGVPLLERFYPWKMVIFHSFFWLVVEPTPLKNISSSVGMMKLPIYHGT